MRWTFEEAPTGLIPWFSTLREILTVHFAASPSPLQGKPTQAQDVGRRISGAISGEASTKSTQDSTSRQRAIFGAIAGGSSLKPRHTKYPSQTHLPRIYIICRCLSFSSTPLHPCRFIRPLFPNPLLSFLLAIFLFAHVLVRLPRRYG